MSWTPEQHRAYLERRKTSKAALTFIKEMGATPLENAFLPDDQVMSEQQVRDKSSCASIDDQIQAETIRDEVKAEKELHRLIAQECHRRGWIPWHGSTAHKTKMTLGMPDFTILGRKDVKWDKPGMNVECFQPFTLFVECKRPGGRISKEQHEMIEKAAKLGHTIHVVTSFQQFLILL